MIPEPVFPHKIYLYKYFRIFPIYFHIFPMYFHIFPIYFHLSKNSMQKKPTPETAAEHHLFRGYLIMDKFDKIIFIPLIFPHPKSISHGILKVGKELQDQIQAFPTHPMTIKPPRKSQIYSFFEHFQDRFRIKKKPRRFFQKQLEFQLECCRYIHGISTEFPRWQRVSPPPVCGFRNK